eukprot:scaffold282776_cov17-Prasinocladus_malaysianus.AAC.1
MVVDVIWDRVSESKVQASAAIAELLRRRKQLPLTDDKMHRWYRERLEWTGADSSNSSRTLTLGDCMDAFNAFNKGDSPESGLPSQAVQWQHVDARYQPFNPSDYNLTKDRSELSRGQVFDIIKDRDDLPTVAQITALQDNYRVKPADLPGTYKRAQETLRSLRAMAKLSNAPTLTLKRKRVRDDIVNSAR